ncbi:hypothetical protein A2935_03200 [Candidatus Wolfebacteria bacterium RIFCSPLOWO2_01_FULL_47_17b]|uniref:Uncharacterized protein n=1 Tax=Candidatus Wolfebacteria bacterium RIFCSPLOWO2_01_FULL_47_17b TaxID=1802558 RepID=A0A1F8DYG2_9BACT|nr:MAG: hypothetical protein A2935_03200 [Candidatus Wolfebacteria bacterium RIFCSPLOWO2_01_FULL_47_17b]
MEQVIVERTQKYLIVKIPIRAEVEGRAELPPRARRIVDRAIAEGLADVTSGRVFGPFSSVQGFKAALKRRPA